MHIVIRDGQIYYGEKDTPEEKPCSNTDAGGIIKKLILPDGFRVGIKNLDNILKEVADLKLCDSGMIKTELLKKVKAGNYVARSAENDYLAALFREYQLKYGGSDAAKDLNKPEVHKHMAG